MSKWPKRYQLAHPPVSKAAWLVHFYCCHFHWMCKFQFSPGLLRHLLPCKCQISRLWLRYVPSCAHPAGSSSKSKPVYNRGRCIFLIVNELMSTSLSNNALLNTQWDCCNRVSFRNHKPPVTAHLRWVIQCILQYLRYAQPLWSSGCFSGWKSTCWGQSVFTAF